MKAVLQNAAQSLLIHDTVNRFCESTFGRISDYFRIQRQVAGFKKIESSLAKGIPDLTVLKGPFKGLLYPSLNSVGSALAPKLLGTYESELHECIEKLFENQYEHIYDIGCAEGYYAVGTALRLPSVSVTSYDICPLAQKLCNEMAGANGVGGQVAVKGFCSPRELGDSCRSRRTLIICDCEGFELDLFGGEVISGIAESDLIIEIHDFLGQAIGATLAARLAPTHSIEVIRAQAPREKIKHLPESFFGKFTEWEQELFVTESRPDGMYWMIAIAKCREKINLSS